MGFEGNVGCGMRVKIKPTEAQPKYKKFKGVDYDDERQTIPGNPRGIIKH